MYIGSVLSFMKIGGQTPKNVHDVRKVCLEMSLCILECFIDFFVFVFDEIYVGVNKPVYDHFEL